MQQTASYVAVVAVEELKDGFVASREVEGRALLFAKTATGVYVYDAICPHSAFEIGPARMRHGCEIECQMHGARFRADESGGVLKGPAKEPLDVVTSRVTDGMVEVLVDWLF